MSSDDTDRGICILSFDGGGPGTYSQLLLVKEYMSRLATDLGVEEDSLYPADYFDLMGGVGFGGIVALMLGHLRMTTNQTIDALLTVASAVFPYESDVKKSPEMNTQNLKLAIEDLLAAREISVDTKMNDKTRLSTKCKVVIYAATSNNMTRPQLFRTYATRGSTPNPTIVDALCATTVIPGTFSSVKIGPRGREQNFSGAPMGANNPTRELLREAGIVFGKDTRVAQIISLGAQLPNPELYKLRDPAEIPSEFLKSSSRQCEIVAEELEQRLINVDAYVRLNVPSGIESSAIDDWRGLASIEGHTSGYIETEVTGRTFERSLWYLKSRIGTATLAHINYSSNNKVTVKMAPAVSSYHVVRQKEWEILLLHLVGLSCSRQRVFCITGMAGCGKTQLVSYFLQEKGSQYTKSVFVDASSAFSIKADLRAWAQSLGTDHEGDVWEDALKILSSGLYQGKWVLILDNADNPDLNLSLFFPKCHSGTIIITSRNRSVGDLSNTHHLELGEMSTDEAVLTLLKAARRQLPLPKEEVDSAYSLVGMLGKLAVAIVQAGAYCHQLSSTTQGTLKQFTFTQYEALFSQKRVELMKSTESFSLDSYQLGAYSAFDLSYKAIPNSAKAFLHLSSSFHYSDISLAIYATAAKGGFEDQLILTQRPDDHKDTIANLKMLLCTRGDWSELLVHEMIRTLRSFSLITASSVSNTVFLNLHPLVHAWARDMLPPGSQKYQRMAMQILTSCVGVDNTQIYRYVLPHIRGVHDRIPGDGPHINDQYAAGTVFKDQRYYEDAERTFIRVLGSKKKLGRRKAAVVGMLAMTYRAQGNLDKAEKLALEALEQCRSLFVKGNSDPETALENHISTINAMVGLAAVYESQDRHIDAEKMKLKAMRLQTELTGPSHPETLITMANLAVTYSSQGRHEEAESLELKVLEGRRQLLGEDNPETLHAALNLSITYRQQGKLKEAEKLQLKALEQAKKVLGEGHRITVGLVTSLATTYQQQGRDASSTELDLQVVEQLRKRLGKDHPETVNALSDLAHGYYKQLDLNRALPLLMEVVPATLRIWGKEHAYSRDRVDALACIFELLGQGEKARRVKGLLL